MKKAAAFCLTVILVLSAFAGSALAFSVSFKEYAGDVQFTGDVDGAGAVVLLDADSQTILYQKNIDQQIEPASTTKILTLLIALEQGNMDDVVSISSDETYPTVRGSQLGLKAGEEVVFKDLINGMMMASGNDAAVALANHMAGSVDAFAVMMNAKAAEIGMTNSNFVTPHGMHNENHLTTARDMAILTLYALQNSQFVQIVSQKSYTMPADNKHSGEWVVENTNKLLKPDETYYYEYATGIKTGSTPTQYAGDCLASSASKDGMNLVCLIFKTEEGDPLRWTLTKDLYEWGFENFITADVADLLEGVEPVQATVENAAAGDSGLLEFSKPQAGTVKVTLEKSLIEGILDKTDTVQATAVFNTETLEAPIEKDFSLGTVTYSSVNTGKAIYQDNLIAPRDVVKAGTEPNASGSTAIEEQTPAPPVTIDDNKNSGIWWLLLLPAGLIAFLVVRLLTVNQRKHKRFKHRQPHYSYKIKKR